MEKKYFPESELIINSDGSCFHLHLTPDHLADKVILVGDPGRVATVAAHFDSIEHEVASREFHTITGTYKGKRITVQSTGIGCDNIDIVMNELDALANIDFDTRTEKDTHRSLTLVGFDGLLNYYAARDSVCDLDLEEAFKQHMEWSEKKGAPYVATACPELIDRIAGEEMVRGITIACGGFYGPQGRQLRLAIQDPQQNEKVERFRYTTPDGKELKICNFEMESSALAGMAAMLGHKAMTCCMVVANRYQKKMDTEYKNTIDNLITLVLDRI